MKFDVKIEWVIDDDQLNITAGSEETVKIDSGDVEANADDIIAAVEDELAQKYGVSFKLSRDANIDDGDFVILNLDMVLEDMKFEEFQEKTQYTRM